MLAGENRDQLVLRAQAAAADHWHQTGDEQKDAGVIYQPPVNHVHNNQSQSVWHHANISINISNQDKTALKIPL